jgi:hypothetical protein
MEATMKHTLRSQSLISAVAIFVLILFFVPGASAAPPTPKPPVAVGNLPSVPQLADNPIIQSFSTPTPKIVQGDPLRVDWNVVPGTGGSPITQVTIINKVGGIVHGSTSATGSYTLSSTASLGGTATFTLMVRAMNAKGNFSTQSMTVNTITATEAWSKITIKDLAANPVRFYVGTPIDFEVYITNNNFGIVVKPVNIFITQGTRVVANLTDAELSYPTSKRTLRDSGFQAVLGGTYTVDLEYKGLHKTRIYRTVPTTIYSIEPD